MRSACSTRVRSAGIAVILACCYIGHQARPSPGSRPDHAEGWYYEIVCDRRRRLPSLRRVPRTSVRAFRQHHLVHRWRLGSPMRRVTGWTPSPRASSPQGVPEPVHGACPRPRSADASVRGLRLAGCQLHIHLRDRPSVRCIADWQREPGLAVLAASSRPMRASTTPRQLQIRRQAWWSVLCGANGHCMGNNPIWLFWEGWQEALDLPASGAMARWGAFFRALPWSGARARHRAPSGHRRAGRGARPRPRDGGDDRRMDGWAWPICRCSGP